MIILGDHTFHDTMILGDAYGDKLRTLDNPIILGDACGGKLRTFDYTMI